MNVDKAWLLIVAFWAIVIDQLGGRGTHVVTLITFMGIDYFAGLMIPIAFQKSKKREDGKLDSHTCFKGLMKKGLALGMVFIAHRLDLVLSVTFICDAVMVALIVGETVSIIEHAEVVGIPIPTVLRRAITLMRDKVEEDVSQGGKAEGDKHERGE
jgi:toxin secretion/phage lysis holin